METPMIAENTVAKHSATARAHRSRVYIRRLGEGKTKCPEHGVLVNFATRGNPSFCCVCGDQFYADQYPGPRAAVTYEGKVRGHVCPPCLLAPEVALRKRAMLNLNHWRDSIRTATSQELMWIETLAIDASALSVIAAALTYGLFIEAGGLRGFLAFHGYQPSDLKWYDLPELAAAAGMPS